MFRLKESIHVNAPLERCFLLSTHVGLVQQTIGLEPVEGRTQGLVTGGDRVLWRGWKFGLPARHETLITAYEPFTFFQDSMASGRFKSFAHDHRFERVDGQTLMVDIVRFRLPLGRLGKVVARRVVAPHILALMLRRFTLLKRIAESDEWERYLEGVPVSVPTL